jgi:hypothetical protein
MAESKRENAALSSKDVGTLGIAKDGSLEIKPRIAEAVGIVAKSSKGGPSRSKRLEEAMSAAVLKAAEDGITDPAEIKKLMVEAHRSVKD